MEHTGTLGDRLTQAMKRRGLKNPDVATRLGVHVVTVSKWRSDRQAPDDESVLRLARLLQVTPAWLRYGSDSAAGESGSGSVGIVREAAPDEYGLSEQDVARFDPQGKLLIRFSPPVYEVVYPLLFDLEAAGVGREGQDSAHAFLAQLYAGMLTPNHRPRSVNEQIADARDGVAFLRAVWQRRGVLELPPLDISETPDPDAVSGDEFTKQLPSQRKKPKAG